MFVHPHLWDLPYVTFETETLQISANLKQSIWYTNLLWDEFRYPVNHTHDAHYIQISIKYHIWSLLCFSFERERNKKDFRIQNTHHPVAVRTPLPHRTCSSPSQAARALLHTVHLPGNYTYNFHLLPQRPSLRKTAGCWLGVPQRPPELPYVELLLKSQLGKQALSETSFCSSLHKCESSCPARCTGTAHKQIV